MEKISFRYSVVEGENINTYLVTTDDLTELDERIKSYSREGIVEIHGEGSPGMIESIPGMIEFILRRRILKCHDKIIDAEMKSEPIYRGRYGSPHRSTMVAIVQDYPILWHVIFNNSTDQYFQELKNYLDNEEIIYDDNIPEEIKIEFVNNFLDSLHFELESSKSIFFINKEIEMLSAMDDSINRRNLIEELALKIQVSQKNAETNKKLSNQLNKKKILIKK